MTAWGVLIAGLLYLFDAIRFARVDPPMSLALLCWAIANGALAWKMGR